MPVTRPNGRYTPSTMALMIAVACIFAAILAVSVACDEEGEVLPAQTPTPLVKPSGYPGPDETPPVSPYPVYPEFSPRYQEPPTPTTPASINVRGVQVSLAEGMTYGIVRCGGECTDTRSYQMVQYGLGTATYSWIMFSDEGLKASSIQPEHAALFKPLLDALK